MNDKRQPPQIRLTAILVWTACSAVYFATPNFLPLIPASNKVLCLTVLCSGLTVASVYCCTDARFWVIAVVIILNVAGGGYFMTYSFERYVFRFF